MFYLCWCIFSHKQMQKITSKKILTLPVSYVYMNIKIMHQFLFCIFILHSQKKVHVSLECFFSPYFNIQYMYVFHWQILYWEVGPHCINIALWGFFISEHQICEWLHVWEDNINANKLLLRTPQLVLVITNVHELTKSVLLRRWEAARCVKFFSYMRVL